MPKISIIIPVYNVGKYLNKCIESVLVQTVLDFELILVDDGSFDGSGKACEEYAEQDSRITVIHKNNNGVSSARNTGIRYSRGEYIYFLDSDDYLESAFLETMLARITDVGADLVSCGFEEVDEEGTVLNTLSESTRTVLLPNPEDNLKTLIRLLCGMPTWCVWRRLFKGAVIRKNEIAFCETSENYAEDLTFLSEYLLFCRSISFIDYAGYKYVQRNESLAHQNKKSYRLKAMNENSKFLQGYLVKSCLSDKQSAVLPLMHFLIMDTEYQRIQYAGKLVSLTAELSKVDDQKFYKRYTRKILFQRKYLKRYFSNSQIHRIRGISFYCLHGNYKLFCYLDNIYYRFFNK